MGKKPTKRTGPAAPSVLCDWVLWWRPSGGEMVDPVLDCNRDSTTDRDILVRELTRRFSGRFEWHPAGHDPRLPAEKLAGLRRTAGERVVAWLEPHPVTDAAVGLFRQIKLMREAGFGEPEVECQVREVKTKDLEPGWGPSPLAVTEGAKAALSRPEDLSERQVSILGELSEHAANAIKADDLKKQLRCRMAAVYDALRAMKKATLIDRTSGRAGAYFRLPLGTAWYEAVRRAR